MNDPTRFSFADSPSSLFSSANSTLVPVADDPSGIDPESLLPLSPLQTTIKANTTAITLPPGEESADDVLSFPPPPHLPVFRSPSPVHSSTPRLGPLTQGLVDRMLELRQVDGKDDGAVYRREIEDLKSELLAAQLQLEEKETVIRELRDQLLAHALQQNPPPPPNDSRPPLPPTTNDSLPPPPTTNGSRPPNNSCPAPLTNNHHPPANDSHPAGDYLPVISKSKKKKMKRRQRLEAANSGGDVTRPPGCDSFQLRRPPPPPASTQPTTQHQQSLPILHVYHDSNLKGCTAAELRPIIDKNNRDNKKQTTTFNIILNETFTLPQTLAKIKNTSFNSHDQVIINTMTNDARHTKTRQQRTPTKTKQIQTDIIKHLITFIPAENVTILEAPPLLDSPSSDIFPYNAASYSLSHQFGIRFSGTLIGETHLWDDGYHVHKKSRHLLLKSLAAAAAGVNPRSHYKLSRPPYGQFGPWAAPKGQGMMPNYRDSALAQPLLFRRLAPIRPLMNHIRRFN